MGTLPVQYYASPNVRIDLIQENLAVGGIDQRHSIVTATNYEVLSNADILRRFDPNPALVTVYDLVWSKACRGRISKRNAVPGAVFGAVMLEKDFRGRENPKPNLISIGTAICYIDLLAEQDLNSYRSIRDILRTNTDSWGIQQYYLPLSRFYWKVWTVLEKI